jgi:hypothetical protein
MPTKREREYYRMGFQDGRRFQREGFMETDRDIDRFSTNIEPLYDQLSGTGFGPNRPEKRKRKLSDWQKYIKNKRNHIKYRDGKLNLKKMGVEFRRKKRR